MARGSLWQIYKKRVKPPIFDASNVHSRAFGFVFVPVYRCSPAIYRAKKRNTKKKSANFVAKVPVKRRKTGSFSAKAAHLCTLLGFPPSELPFHGLTRSAFSAPFARLPDLSAPPPAGAGGVFPHATRWLREMLPPLTRGRTFAWNCTPPCPKTSRSQTPTREERSA